MDVFKKLMDTLMPIEEEYVVEQPAKPAVQEEAATAEKAEVVSSTTYTQKVVNGEDIVYHIPDAEPAPKPAAPKPMASRPKLTVHTTKIPELDVEIYTPKDFDAVTAIADDLKAKKAAVVNYEQIEQAEQRRICDFINGVCYVLQGEARRISNMMVLYVPEGVSVDDVKVL